MQETLREPECLITGHLRHFAFSRVFFNPVTSETELFVTLANG